MSAGTIGIKNSFVLKIIFGFLNEFKKLNIIKYNKNNDKEVKNRSIKPNDNIKYIVL